MPSIFLSCLVVAEMWTDLTEERVLKDLLNGTTPDLGQYMQGIEVPQAIFVYIGGKPRYLIVTFL